MTIEILELPAADPALDTTDLWVVMETAEPTDGEPTWTVGFADPVSRTPFRGDLAADIAEDAASEYAAGLRLDGITGLLVRVAVERREPGHMLPRPLAVSSVHIVA